MALSEQGRTGGTPWVVGINVILMVVLAVALVAGLQWIAYSYGARADVTSSGVNSLTPATEKLLENLDTEIRLTSMYFKTDLEDEDQERYRTAVADLIELYRASNRGRISAEWVNPLQDHEKRKSVLQELAQLAKFKEESAGHRKIIDKFQADVLARTGELITSELSELEAYGAVDERDGRLVGEVRQLFSGLESAIKGAAMDVSDAMASEVPANSAAVSVIRQTYSDVTRMLESVTNAGGQLASAPGRHSPAVEAFFVEAKERYADLLELLKSEQEAIKELPTLELDNVLRELRTETGNSLLVAASDDAKVVSFRSIWQPINPGMAAGGFNDRKFLGEQKLTSAILQLTKKEKPAVVFVRHGGPSVLFGGFMPGQPEALFGDMKVQLEDANFSVHEWDLATENEMPAIDPAPSRKLFVVLRPNPSPQGPMGQPPQQAPFTPENLETLKKAMGDAPRALFVAGFVPSMGGFPAPYEYAEFLNTEWGIEASMDRVLLDVEPIGPGRYRFERDPVQMTDCRFAEKHPITGELAQSRTFLPWVSPITIKQDAPEGVQVERIGWLSRRDGLWSISDISFYAKQQTNESIVRNSGDYDGEFTMAAAATKGDAKIVVISSTNFAADSVALASEMVLSAQGLSIRPRNPGNAALFINTLHCLNDNAEWMNLGTPIDTTTIAIDKNSSSMTFVRALVLGIWPGLAMFGGFVVWLVRRR